MDTIESEGVDNLTRTGIGPVVAETWQEFVRTIIIKPINIIKLTKTYAQRI